MALGLSGRVARAFLQSRLTPLLTAASLVAGVGAVLTTPREEEPQISVPMVDVFSAFPGATPEEVDRRITEPLERRLWEISGVEHLYSRSGPSGAMTTVRFRVGDDPEESVVKVFAKLAGTPALVKLHTIDEVPILTLTFWGGGYDEYLLHQIGGELRNELQRIPDVAQIDLIGGAPRVVEVTPDPVRLAAHGLSPAQLLQSLEAANAVLPAGSVLDANRHIELRAGRFLERREDVEQVLVGITDGRGIRLGEAAEVHDGPGEPVWYVSHLSPESGGSQAAVTLAIAKRPGVNAAVLADRVLEHVGALRGRLVPTDLRLTVTRNYGETANEKAMELLSHILIATLGVSLLVWLALGWREAVVVLVAVPVTLGLTLLVYRLLGYTLNRITLFALVFAIGILVDDAIVVVENIARHLGMRRGSAADAAVEGVDEVGNPTILATFAVIAAILPMAFVTGLMGPYMRPIPVGASMAMLFSLGVAFIVTPYVALRLVREHHPADGPDRRSRISAAYASWLRRLLARRGERLVFYGAVVTVLLLSIGLVLMRAVTVKMLPFDNKSEFQVVLDFPAGTTLETSARGAQEIAERLAADADVRDVQVYAGVAAPFNFNGLVRHYFLRKGAEVADLQVNLRSRHERDAQSHDVAVRLRPTVEEVARRYGASAKVAEIPPGPPVLATLTAEIYGPTPEARRAAAERVRGIFESVPGVVDVDWTLRAEHPELHLAAVPDAAALAGLAPAEIARAMTAVGGVGAGTLHDPLAADPVDIVVRFAETDRAGSEAVRSLRLPTRTGGLVPATAVALLEERPAPQPVYRKDLKPVVYVTADVARELESPAYAMLEMERGLSAAGIETRWSGPADLTEQVSLNWDGEWRITYEVFRDLGIAFAAVLVLIYLLVVAWFQSYRIPLVIMAPIPLTLAGILPAHWLGGAFFTATSMIGMIALAGIIVRNSILLVDFVEQARARGMATAEAVVEAGVVRARPILLTAAAVVVGGAVMVRDPIFQGLGIAMISGAVVATLLTLVVIPLLYADVAGPAGPVDAKP
ncbi:MAG TPA: efflux RND transporter permease subunit [Gemmatimonadales bacterium]|jgi:multidrug efflux pump subunit AcrB